MTRSVERDVRRSSAALNGAVWLLLVAVAFLRAPGRTSFDTKSDLAIDASAFLARSLHLWNDRASFGELQNQAYGYLLPQGSFAWLGQLVAPPWVVQRLWVAVLLVVAYEGTRRLFLGLARPEAGPLVPGAAVLAGLAYAAAPRVGGIAGVLSSEVNPPALLPWAVLAVVGYANGSLSARTAGLGAGVAVLLMGGVNAVAVVACLPLIALAVLTRVPSGRRRPVAGWTAVGVAGGILWWLGPLVLLGRYSPPFLDFIETSEATTSPLGWANVTRGAVHWVAFTATDTPALPGAYALHATALGVLVTWAVAVVGLLGLTRRDVPGRALLVGSFCLGAVALTLGHADALHGPLTGVVRDLLDGPLSMLRNVHKIDPLVRLPLAVGFGHAARVVLVRLRRSDVGLRGLGRVVVGALAVVVLVPLALAPDRAEGWRELPRSWEQAALFVARERPEGTTLVLPAAGFGEQTWGRTVDEPFQSVARTPWVSRSQVPLSPPQTIRLLDALVARTEDPGGGTALADVLARAGVRTLVVRHDLVRSALDPEVTRRVGQVLGSAPGITRAATFGTDETARVDVWSVDRVVPTVEAVETSSLAWVRGGAEDVVAAVESGVLGNDRPSVMVGDAGPLAASREGAAPDVVGDGIARRERAFGLVRDATGPVLAAREAFTSRRPVHDYPGTPNTPPAVAEYDGIARVLASSGTASAETVGAVRPDQSAWAALDGRLTTAWHSDVFTRPVGQWWEVDLGDPRPVASVGLVADVNPFDGVPVRRLVVTTDDGQRVRAAVHPETGVAQVTLDGAAVSRIRVTVDAVAGDVARGSVGLAEVAVPGLRPARRVVIPPADAGASTSFVLRTAPSARACGVVDGVPSCTTTPVRGQEEGGGVSRRLTLDAPATVTPSAEVRARAGGSTAALFDPLGDGVRVRADSVFGDDPAVVGSFAMDGDERTHWLAQPLARSATLTLTSTQQAEISGLAVRARGSVATLPATARVSNGTTSRDVDLSGGSATFPALRGRTFTVTLSAAPGLPLEHPLGVGELDVTGLEDLVYAPDLDARTGAPCGLGPPLLVDGQRLDTRVDGTLRDVRDGRALTATACDGALRLGAGEHVVEWLPVDRWEVTTVRLVPSDREAVPVVRRETRVLASDTTHRVVRVGPGGQAVLRIAQNTNPGWRATLDGAELAPVRVDGWQQGFVVPGGAGGEVRLEFTPDGTYRTALLLGGLVAALLVCGAVASSVVDLRRPGSAGRRVEASVAPSRRRAPDTVLWAGFAVAGGLLGGVAVLVGALAWAVPRVRSGVGLLAGGLLVAAALGQVWWVATGGPAGSPPLVVDLAAGVSVTVLVARALAVPGPRRAATKERSADG